MIPLRDNIPHRRIPFVSVTLIGINLVVFLYEMMLGDRLKSIVYLYGFVPQNLFASVGLIDKTLPIFTGMFLHASWAHLIGNLLFMWIFADNVEDRLGHFRFIVLYFLSGIIAMLVHTFFNLNSEIPAIGASGAIAGVLGAYFMMFPNARVLTLVPLFFFWEIIELPAFVFLGLWFVYQFFLGVSSLGVYGSGIAFWAHIGGFLAGILFLKLLRR